jgi:hypothetical protein
MVQIYVAAAIHNGFLWNSNGWLSLNDQEREICGQYPHLLESYHYINKQKTVDIIREGGIQVFLDSGAFSAWTLGVDLSVAEYCDYIKRNEDIIRKDDGALMASVMDGIGDPLQTYRNQLDLEWYIANYDYITIGGMVGKSTPQLMIWLDRIWNKYMVDGSGNPRIKVHAFGVTSIPLMEAYPWYSCDSSSWVQVAAFGNIMFPNIGALGVSGQSPKRHEAGQHVSTLQPPEVAYMHRLFEQYGFSYDQLSGSTYSRRAWNILMYREISASINAEKGAKYRTHNQELF